MTTPSRRRGLAPAFAAGALALGLTLTGAAPALAAPSASAVTITATPTVDVGGTVDVEVGLTGAVDLYAARFTVTFDPTLLSYVDGSTTGPSGGFDSVTTGPGTVTVVHSRLGSSPALAGDIPWSLDFVAVAPGSGTVGVQSVELVDPQGATTAVDGTDEAPVTVNGVVTEPDPGTGGGGTGGGGASPGAGTGTGTASGGNADDALAGTGAAVTGGLVAAGLLLAAGVVLVLRRRAARVS
ncbi:cohesin domain-containing protein [Diaminobutyricimonas aerilata]|uniref:Cohesin domain-containing protein n=1 Tax=Diaminobutyricimonas aerilata TaxID=1162967 RepID=A0A2M9CMX0_9MICO|nr:cohesin domain-containing protein [Diaminobutyricimonas aerilata]PJJ73222.1 cohesin domain-containing protein [Diaminobutyricimonas aerilata]